MPSDSSPMSHVLDDLEKSGHDDAVSVGDVMEMFQHRSLGALLTVFSLLAALPVIGGIPGMSILTGSLILIAIAQSLLGGGALWLPEAVKRREISRDTFDKGIEKARPWLQGIDRLVKPRLKVLSAGRANRWLVSLACAVLAVTFYPMAFVPWGVTAPALGVLAFGLGLMGCDGLFVLAGYLCSAVTAYILSVFFL